MTVFKMIRGIDPRQYAEILANGGICTCGCGEKVDLSQFECTIADLEAEGVPAETLELLKAMTGQVPPPADETFSEHLRRVVLDREPIVKALHEELDTKFAAGLREERAKMDDEVEEPVQRYGNYMHLFTGGKYYPLDPRAAEVDIRDIAHSLSTKARYAGHTAYPFWVAQHSCYTAVYSVPGFNKPVHRLARLLHDASESYNGDLIRPLKHSEDFRAPFSKVEALNERAISMRFGIPYPFEPHIKIADEAVTAAEVEQLINKLPGEVFDHPLHDASVVAPFKFREWDWRLAEGRFLSLFNKLVTDTFINAPDEFFDSEAYRLELMQFVK